MSPEQLWSTARRILGVYFLVTGALYLPGAVTVFGYETAGSPRWPLVVTALCEGVIALFAGWWLFQSTGPASDDRAEAWKDGSFALVLQLMGVYFVVEGLAEAVGLGVNMYFFGEAWQVRFGTFAGAVLKLAAGVLLVAKPFEIGEKIVSLRKTPSY